MKKITLLLLITLCFYQCKAQKATIMEQNNNIPSITRDSEVFDTLTYNKYRTNMKSSYVRVKLDKKKYLEMSKGINQHHSSEYYSDSYFFINKIFYPNNNIKFKGIVFNSSFRKGIWYFYKEDGSFSHEVDYDVPYKFTWNDILQYCKDHNIELNKGYIDGGWHTTIRRVSAEKIKTSPDIKPAWIIEYYVLGGKGYVETIILDGVTGKEVERTQRDLPGE
ncbi:hypothetical protein [uncultured Algibacter sp.]|uniref:hypothetical protein n=1 Tax=uncultured Algibacter sp. TaxID=298659 RepID=UPI003216BEEC